MKVDFIPINEIIPYARNPRRNQEAVAMVKASIKEYGWQQPIVVDAENVIIAGHTRYFAAIELGMTEVPVHVALGLTSTQIKAYRIMDNKSHETSEWDYELLKLEIDDIEELGFDIELTGFSIPEKDILIGEEVNENEAWKGMPEFNNEEQPYFMTIKINFDCQESVDDFSKLIGQVVTEKTKYINFPKKIIKNDSFYLDDKK